MTNTTPDLWLPFQPLVITHHWPIFVLWVVGKGPLFKKCTPPPFHFLPPGLGWQLLTMAANGFQHVPFLLPDAGVQLIDDEVPDTRYTPPGFFQLFFLRQTVDNTNAYADLRLTNHSLWPHSVPRDWSHMSTEELIWH